MASEREELLESWLDQWEEACEQGNTLSPEMLCRDNPELLAELKRRIRELEQLDHFLESAPSDDPNLPFVEIQAGRYRAKKLHAPGGLGEVFYAADDELDREVALKRLRPSIAWSRDARRRFILEAQITGRLEHPGVVPVYGLGKDPQGNPYYAMRFIRGKTLDQATEEYHEGQDKSSEQRLQGLRNLLQALKSACQTIAYAHDHGVVHRDIKPGNIILGDYGEVLVIDWGLAKSQHAPSSDATETDRRPAPEAPTPPPPRSNPDDTANYRLDPTEAGQVKGTPAYMSPEQARGNFVDAASDVYSLGATLYKILTGRPPFTGKSAEEVIAHVMRHDLVSPRQRKSAVSPALNAICLKAMHEDPKQRYASALALAQDLQNWLDDVPTVAWPEPLAVRGQRWLRQHRGVVIAGVIAWCLFLVLAAVWTARERTLNKELRLALKTAQEERTRAEKEQKLADFQAKRADENYQLARRTVQNMLFRTNEPRWNDVLKIQQLRREQSEIALGFFETIASQPGQEHSVRRDVAWGLIEAGKLEIALGKEKEGRDKLRQAVAATEAIYNEARDDARVSMLRSDALMGHGAFLPIPEALPVMQEGVEVLEANWKKHPQSPPIRHALIDGLITFGAGLINNRDYAQAERHLVRAIELSQETLKATPDDTARLAVCARARVNLCTVYRLTKRPAPTREQHALAERDFERLFKLDPFDRTTVGGLAVLRVNGAYDLAAEGKQVEAVAYLQRNVPMLEAVLKQEPNDTEYRDGLYRTYGLSAMFLRETGKIREAAESWEKSLEFVGDKDKPLRLVEATEFWIGAKDLTRALEAGRRASAQVPVTAPAALWDRQAQVLNRLSTAIAGDEQMPAEDRNKAVVELRTLAAIATTRAGANSAQSILQGTLDFLRGKP